MLILGVLEIDIVGGLMLCVWLLFYVEVDWSRVVLEHVFFEGVVVFWFDLVWFDVGLG